MDAAERRYRELVEDIRAEFPAFRIRPKHASRLQRALGAALAVATAGRMRTYMTHYQTTIGSTVYVTADWDRRAADARYVTLRHERVHLRQFARLGVPLMAVLYLLVPLPVGLAWFRAHFEREAYAETIRAAAEVYGVAAVRDPGFRRQILAQFTGPSYGWMWPFRRGLDRWYDSVLAGVSERE
ncbi:MAG: hypothetical protein D6689_05305 [Deltaproteobacteria bacterium]|nr:MAG: hypothetical protein D6689_05305 [Deltaproteobacteria bacterium]